MQPIIKRRTLDTNYDEQLFPNLHPVLSRLYYTRGVTDEAELDYRLNFLLKPNFKGIGEAVELLVHAIEAQQRILIVGDYDADGATSTALAVRCLTEMGARHVDFLVPNRFEYGYGLSPEIVQVASQFSPHLIITVDNGIASIEGVAAAKSLGYSVLVTDHHLPGERLPEADAIVNPNQPDCEFSSKAAAGVAVIFYVMLALRGQLRSQGWFGGSRPEPNLARFLDLVALGTVADVVPLDFNNRILVSQGLQRIRSGAACSGIQALLRVAGRSPSKVRAMDLGFVVGPRLNAAGRLDDMSLGIRCLLTDSDAEALALAQELDQLNQERRAIEASMQAEAMAYLDTIVADAEQDMPLGVCLYRADWHQGVIGIVASRVKDRLHRPTIVFADDGEDHIKGSGRSVKGVHLRDALEYVAVRCPGLLTKFGGHAMAAGLSLKKSDLNTFKKVFAQAIDFQLGERGLIASVESDGPLLAVDMNTALADLLAAAGPWGQAFPEPCFDGEFELVQQKIVGTKHLKMVLAMDSQRQQLVDAIAFGVDLNRWPDTRCARVKAVYKLSVNEYNGRRNVQLIVDHLEAI